MLIDMGSEVTVLEALPRILATTDAEVGSVVARSFKKRGVNVQEGARITGIDGARELTVSWETDARCAVGRRRQGDRVDRPRAAVEWNRARGSRASASTTAGMSSSTNNWRRVSPVSSLPAT